MTTQMQAIKQLSSIHVFVSQLNNILSMKWTYPSLGHTLRAYIEKRLNDQYFDTNLLVTNRYYYHHYNNLWIYSQTSELLPLSSKVLPDVKQFSIVIIAKDFNPEKYEVLTKIFMKIYEKTGDIQKLLSYYLTLLINDSFSINEEHLNHCQKFNVQDYDCPQVIHSKSPIKSIIKMFGLDVILIYTALILKRRVAVYHHKLDTLLQFIRALPAFIWHRPDIYQILYPFVELSSTDEIQDLQLHNHYIAGFIESEAQNRIDLYDLYVNLAAVEITVNHSCKEVFAMTKSHKEIAVFLTRQADINNNNDFHVIKDICDKNLEIINNLKIMGTIDETCDQHNGSNSSSVVTLEALRQRNLNPNLENFLWNLAVAEDLN